MKVIYITGFMGSGKTTVGAILGDMTGLPVYDIDQEVIKAEGMNISEIFADKGEAYFRQRESGMLRSLPAADAIITTGGGTVLQEENRKYMKENGRVVFLDCRIEEIERRLAADSSRPLLAGNKRADLRRLYEERLPVYREAEITISINRQTAEEAAAEILQRIDP
ncbi:shikimate kinase [Peribacillus sp. SCS-26]|uniref:shikimate kinase n=1 Tax=Paraperibacillus marinus TaxID=3115295 RepID=UPI0039066D57